MYRFVDLSISGFIDLLFYRFIDMSIYNFIDLWIYRFLDLSICCFIDSLICPFVLFVHFANSIYICSVCQFHPFHPFVLGQKNLAPRIALNYGIPLIFYGDPEAEYGNPIAENESSLRKKSYYATRDLNDCYIGGVSVPEILDTYSFSLNDLSSYLPASYNELETAKIEVHYMGYYLKWTPQEAYYYAVKNTGFKPRPFRTQGTYSRYNSIDDKIDDLHYYTTYIKFGIGRASYDVSQEIRNKHLTIEEGKKLIKKYDGEFPDEYFNDIMDYLDIKKNLFLIFCKVLFSKFSELKISKSYDPTVEALFDNIFKAYHSSFNLSLIHI